MLFDGKELERTEMQTFFTNFDLFKLAQYLCFVGNLVVWCQKNLKF